MSESKNEKWIVAYSGDDRHVTGHQASGFREASKFAHMLFRGGYEVHAIYREEAGDSIDWDTFKKSLFLKLHGSENSDKSEES